MSILKKAAKFFGLNDETWMRHANPWSVWTRFAVLPLLALAIWSRDWIGWYSLIPIAVLVFWTWINPRFFRPPATTKHWSSKAVFGERVWLRRQERPVAAHHRLPTIVLQILTGVGLPFLIWGLWAFQVWPVILGLFVVVLGKMWFLDRMVWIYEEAKHEHEDYAEWEY